MKMHAYLYVLNIINNMKKMTILMVTRNYGDLKKTLLLKKVELQSDNYSWI